jgi:hypothetical protein
MGQAESGERRIHHLIDVVADELAVIGVVADELAVNVTFGLRLPFFELRPIQAAPRRKAQIDAIMDDQIALCRRHLERTS